MTNSAFDVPAAGDSPAELADWVELEAIRAADRNVSLRDLVQALRRTGTADTAVDPDASSYRRDAGSEISESVAESAFAEIARRSLACTPDRYPFDVYDNYIQLKPEWRSAPYVFLLLLSRFGLDAGVGDPERTFEDVAARAAVEYLGGDANCRGVAFGFPRRYEHKAFADALDDLCQQLGEGGGHRKRPRIKDQKDGKLDVVAWRPFPDSKAGQIIVFGQCATGSRWRGKVSELQPAEFWSFWLLDPPGVIPAKALFLPLCVPDDQWDLTTTYGGVVFDRCRISSLVDPRTLESDLSREAREWSDSVLQELGI